MQPVTVKVVDLKKKLEENRAEHRAIFEEALEGYRAKAIELLEQHIVKIKKGKVERVAVSLPVPEDHTDDYDRVITMLDMHTGDTIEMPEHDFQCYVMDDWAWKQQFLTSSASYSKTAAAALGQ